MKSITIRNVPDEVRDELAARAARSGRSLQEYLLNRITELARKPSVRDVLDRARTRVEATGTRLSAEDILEFKDADKK